MTKITIKPNAIKRKLITSNYFFFWSKSNYIIERYVLTSASHYREEERWKIRNRKNSREGKTTEREVLQ